MGNFSGKISNFCPLQTLAGALSFIMKNSTNKGGINMPKIYTSGSFSLNMLGADECILRVRRITKEEATEILRCNEFTSAVGHASTAAVMSQLLGVEIPFNRVEVRLEKGDKVVVFQLMRRVEEGKVLTVEELENFPTALFLVEVVDVVE